MYSRVWAPPDTSFFLFGPRGVGKSSLLRPLFPNAPYFDLLDSGQRHEFSAGVNFVPLETFLKDLPQLLDGVSHQE